MDWLVHVPLSVIETVRSKMDADGLVAVGEKPKPNGEWRHGDELRVVSGPLFGAAGLFVDHVHGRIKALLTILNADRVVELPAAAVAHLRCDEPADPAPNGRRPGRRHRLQMKMREFDGPGGRRYRWPVVDDA